MTNAPLKYQHLAVDQRYALFNNQGNKEQRPESFNQPDQATSHHSIGTGFCRPKMGEPLFKSA